MKRMTVIVTTALFLLWVGIALANDDTVINEIQTEVSETKGKADHNQGRIGALEAALAAEQDTRAAADAALDARLVSVEAYESRIAALETQLTAALGVIDELQNAVTALEPLVDLSNYVIVDYNTINGLVGPHVIFYDTNVHVQNGFGGTESSNGLGNLVIGYNEVGSADILNRDGSHYLLVGTGHEYTAFGGIVIGAGNRSHNTYASVTGGASNTASGDYSSVSGGYSNTASGQASSVSGGEWNTASGGGSSIAAGLSNTASGGVSSVSGGYQNSADHFGATISGGQNLNTTSNYQHLPSP